MPPILWKPSLHTITDDDEKSADPLAKVVDALCTSLRRRQIVGSLNVALATAMLVQNIVRQGKYNTIDELLSYIKYVGRRLVEANPKELASGNIVRQILRLMREEYRAALSAATASQPSSEPQTPYLEAETPGLPVPSTHYLANELHFSSPPRARESRPLPLQQATSYMSYPGGPVTPAIGRQTSLSNFIAMRHSQRSASVLGEGIGSAFGGSGFGMSSMSALASSTFATPPRASSSDELAGGVLSRADSEEFMRQSGKLKPVLVQAIEEVVGELESTHEDVAKGAREHVHSSEIILTLGHSRTVIAFLKQAHKDRSFTVIVAESDPSFLGHQTAASLSAIGIPTILVPDATVFALMPRVTKVIIGCHSVLANGGLFALSGTLGAVLAAKAHAKPVMVVTGQFKFAPAWNLFHDHGAVDFQGPGKVVGFDGNGGGGGVEGAEAANPYYDYIRPELINLFVTNEGDHSPAYIYRLIKEAYDDEDVDL